MDYRNDYYSTNNKYLAYTLSFLGFKFMKFTDENGQVVYSFKRTPEFQKICDEVHRMKKENYFND